MKKFLLILILAISANAWAEEEFNLICNLKEMNHIVESTKEGPKFKFKVANEWVYWTGEIPKNKSEQDLAIEPKVKEYHLQVVFDEDRKGYIYSKELTNGKNIKIKRRNSSYDKNSINIWTKGTIRRLEWIRINRHNGFISFHESLQVGKKREFLGSCI